MNTKNHIAIGIALTFLSACSDRSIKPFTSDGCSSFPDGTFTQQELWLQCCTAHDLTYWQGGTYAQRLEADNQLHQCVSHVGQKEIAKLMLLGVRVGGTPFLPTDFRWGYGWPYPRSYKTLTKSEQNQVDEQLKLTPHIATGD